MNPVYTLTPCFPKTHFNIILPSTPRSSEWPHSFRFFDQHFVCISHQIFLAYFRYVRKAAYGIAPVCWSFCCVSPPRSRFWANWHIFMKFVMNTNRPLLCSFWFLVTFVVKRTAGLGALLTACNVKVKVKLSLCFNCAMKAYWGSEGIAPQFDLGTRWRWVVSFTPRPL
jgi:hypothetical protein